MEWSDIIAGAISIGMVFFTISIHYEVLHIIWIYSGKLRRRPHYALNLFMLVIFATHTLCVWAYGGLYYLLEEYFNFGALGGVPSEHSFISYVYFSTTTYTTVGYGDTYPMGPFRMIAGVEAINGLILIGWSVTLTYFAMERLWGYRIEWKRSGVSKRSHKNIHEDEA
jgi:hypothetical protein